MNFQGTINWRVLRRQQLVAVADIAMACAAIAVAFLLRANLTLEPEQLRAAYVAVPVAGVTAHLAFRLVGTSRAVWRYATLHDLAMLVAGSTLAVLGFVTCMFLWDRLTSVPRAVPVIYWLVLTVGLCGSRLVYGMLIAGEARRAAPRRWEPVLLVGAQGAALVTQLLRMLPQPGLRPVGILDDEMAVGRMVDGVPILGRLDELRRAVSRLAIHGMRPRRIIVTAPHDEIGLESVRALQKRAYADGIAVLALVDLLRLQGGGSRRPTFPLPDLPAMLGRLEARSYAGLKRLADIVMSLAALILLAPVLAAVALVLVAKVGTPVLFRQVRSGRQRASFVLYKFRTMGDAFDDSGRPVADAERTPWIGGLLRRTRLDELPQLWNVLIGDMSMIGPRPLLEGDLAAMPDGGRARSALRPGITGWAQVHGGALLGPDDKLALDLWYIRHTSPRIDLEIMLLTIRMILLGERVDTVEIARARQELAPVAPTPMPPAAMPPTAPVADIPPARRVA